MPVVQFYEGLGKVKKIDANGGADEVYAGCVQAFEGYI